MPILSHYPSTYTCRIYCTLFSFHLLQLSHSAHLVLKLSRSHFLLAYVLKVSGMTVFHFKIKSPVRFSVDLLCLSALFLQTKLQHAPPVWIRVNSEVDDFKNTKLKLQDEQNSPCKRENRTSTVVSNLKYHNCVCVAKTELRESLVFHAT